MESDSPDYYLNRDINGKYSYYGTPYIADGFGVDDNVLIYGHCINYNEAFGKLLKFKRKDYFDKHKIIKFIYFSDSNKIICDEYEIVSVLSLNIYEDDFRYWELIDLTKEEATDLLNDAIKSKGLYLTTTVFEPKDKYIMLSTCDNEKGDGYRVVVVGKVIKES